MISKSAVWLEKRKKCNPEISFTAVRAFPLCEDLPQRNDAHCGPQSLFDRTSLLAAFRKGNGAEVIINKAFLSLSLLIKMKHRGKYRVIINPYESLAAFPLIVSKWNFRYWYFNVCVCTVSGYRGLPKLMSHFQHFWLPFSLFRQKLTFPLQSLSQVKLYKSIILANFWLYDLKWNDPNMIHNNAIKIFKNVSRLGNQAGRGVYIEKRWITCESPIVTLISLLVFKCELFAMQLRRTLRLF